MYCHCNQGNHWNWNFTTYFSFATFTHWEKIHKLPGKCIRPPSKVQVLDSENDVQVVHITVRNEHILVKSLSDSRTMSAKVKKYVSIKN